MCDERIVGVILGVDLETEGALGDAIHRECFENTARDGIERVIESMNIMMFIMSFCHDSVRIIL